MSYSLQYGGARRPLEELRIGNLVRRRTNQGRDHVRFETYDDALAFAPHQPVTLYRDDVPWFTGILTRAPVKQSIRRDVRCFEFDGPWWFLENIVYQQSWKIFSGGTAQFADKGRVILGQDAHERSVDVGAQVSAILSYARDCGAPFNIGTIHVDVPMPLDEGKDLSCAEALLRTLRWAPDTIVWFDYTDVVPVLNAVRQRYLPAHTVDIGELTHMSATPRYDRVVPAVVLKYEKTDTVGYETYSTIDTDIFPKNADPRAVGTLILTVELEGAMSHVLEQPVETRFVATDSHVWWREHLPHLPDNTQITDVRRDGDLPNELVAGGIAEWMHVKVKEETIRAKVSYSTENAEVVGRDVAVKIQTTDATTKTYRKYINERTAEPVPNGLAEKLHEALGNLTYSGELRGNVEISLGTAVNVTGGEPFLSNMNAAVQQIEDHVDLSETRVTFGPPLHLGAHDLVELTRANRHRASSHFSKIRHTGRPGKRIVYPKHARVDNHHADTDAFQKLTLKHEDNGTIELNTHAFKGVIQPREEYVCHNGELKKRYVLASEPN